MNASKLGKLLNKTVKSIYLNDDQSELFFATGYGRGSGILVTTYGDCCSETWFADIVGFDNLIGERVVGVQLLDMPSLEDEDPRSRQEYDEVYGFRLITSKGHCDFAYRNSSNGYYGGDIEDVVNTDEWNISKMTQVTDDVSF